ncbi:MAG: prenyltransferase [Bacteroidetes bacterium]|nr:prenyltransferase [Bacteroidota bacterium]
MKIITNIKQNISINDIISVIKNLNAWFINSRPIALPQSILPVITAIAISFSYAENNNADFSIFLSILSVIAVGIGHLATNLLDDYFDYKKQGLNYRTELSHKGIRSRIHKCPYLSDGSNTISQLLAACIVFFAIVLIIGIIIWLYRGNFIILISVIAAVLAISYSGFPFRFSYNGLGEVIIGIMFGPLAMLGVFYAAVGNFYAILFFFSIPIGLLVLNIIYTHSIIDIEADKQANKRTLAVLIANKKIMIFISFLTNLLPFCIITFGIAIGLISAWYLLVFITLPMAIHLLYLLIQFQKHPNKEFSPRFWMGPFEKWNEKLEAGIGWFLIRWMLARNLVTFFAIIISIVSIILAL